MDLLRFILTYFASKNITLLTAFLCWRPEKLIVLSRMGQNYGIRLNIVTDVYTAPDLPAYDLHREGVLLDTECSYATIILDRASASRAFNYRYSWLLISESHNTSTLEELLSATVILPDADVILLSSNGLVDMYRIKPDQPLVTSTLGINKDSSLEGLKALWARMPTAASRRKDLNNVYLKAATIITQPQNFKGWSDLTMRHIDTFPKLTYSLMMLCAEDLNFRYNMKQADSYGFEQNGSFTGLAGLLQRQRVELGVTSMFMRPDRWRVLHYCSDTIELRVAHCGGRSAFIFRQPSQAEVSNMFVLPFSRGVWLSVAVVVLSAGTLLAMLGHRMRAADPSLGHITALEAFTFTIGTVCQQGFHVTPQLLSARVVMLFAMVSSLFIFTAYSAMIVAILQSPSDAIQTLDDLTHSPMTLGIQKTSYKKVYFAESNDPATQLLYRRKLMPLGEQASLTVVDGVARLRTGLFAFQVEEPSGYDIISKTFAEHEKCGLKQIQAFKLPMVAVPLRKHSGYRELFATRLRWQREVGLMGREQRRWMAERPQCGTASGGFVSVGLNAAEPAARVLAAGAAAAVALLLAERLYHHRRAATQTHATQLRHKRRGAIL